ncbi:MAG: hypothetical protein HY936_08930 [Nitrosomonadales bacterium]|nr:hypothetical protein [Nitrosomonadales bacterium]
MKKIVLSLAGVLAATAFAPEAAAIPAFARQTGMACLSCHQQHYPVLNAFGRAFKAGGYTMMGAQGKIEGEHLSVPDTLNLSMLLKLRYQDQGGPAVDLGDGAGTTTSNGQWQFGDEFVILGGGRVGENTGFFTELVLNAPIATAIGGTLRVPFVFDVGSVKLSVVPFTADGGGPMIGYELASGATLRANRWSEQRRDISGVQYALADGNGNGVFTGAATGFAFVAQNDFGFINYTRWTPNHMIGGGGNVSTDMQSNYLRAAITPSYNEWAFLAGFGIMSGASEVVAGGTVGTANSAIYEARGHFLDAQAHGMLGGKDIGLYANYAKAPRLGGICQTSVAGVGTQGATGCNLFNQGAFDRWAWAVGVDYSIIPHTLHLGAAYRDGRRGAAGQVAGASGTDKSTMVQAIYDFTQNVAFHAIYSSRTGSRYAPTAAGQNESMFMLEAAW